VKLAYQVLFSSCLGLPIAYSHRSSLSLQFNIINKALLQGGRKEPVISKGKNFTSGVQNDAKSAEARRAVAGRVSMQFYTFLYGPGKSLSGRVSGLEM